MSLAFSYTDAEQKMAAVDLSTTVQHAAKVAGQNIQKLSRLVGRENDFLRKKLLQKNISLPLLYVLSVHLKVNLFEPFMSQLPGNLQLTQREAALQNEMEALQTQLAEVTKERDLLKAIVMK